MPEQGSETVGVAAIATQLRRHLETLARLKGELARRKAQKAMIGGGVVIAGALFLGSSLLVGLAAIAAGIATVLEPWIAILILFGGLLVVGLVLVAVGVVLLKRGNRSESDLGAQALTTAAAGDDENA